MVRTDRMDLVIFENRGGLLLLEFLEFFNSNWLVQYVIEVATALTSYILISIQSGGGVVPHNAKTGSEAISLPK